LAQGKNKGTDKKTDKMMTPVPDMVKVGNIVLNIAKHIILFVRNSTKTVNAKETEVCFAKITYLILVYIQI
jgi:hypothetical protein